MRQSCSDAIDKSLQSNIICSICTGYLVDAVTLTECLHFFCRACLLRQLKTDPRCPKCFQELSKDLNSAFCTDQLLQNLVYKLVPNFFWHQLRKRHRALKKGNRKGKSEQEKEVTQKMAELSSHLCSSNEKISLVLEYVPMSSILNESRELEARLEPQNQQRTSFKRYFRCPAKTRLEHLKKLLEAKLAMSESYGVYFIDSSLKTLLKEDYCLQDLVHINSYTRQEPLSLLFTLARLNLDEDKPPVLDMQVMPQLLPETPSLQKHSPNTSTTTPEDQPQIPKMSVCLSSTAFENGSAHPPIITTCSNTPQTSSQPSKKKRKSNAPVKKSSSPNTPVEKKPEIIKTSPSTSSTQNSTMPKPPSPARPKASEAPKPSFPVFPNFAGFNPNTTQLPPYMSAALLANSSYGNANFNLMNGNFMWPGPSFNQQMQIVNGTNSQVKKSPTKKTKNAAETGQMPNQELNFMLQQQQKQLVKQMFGQSGMATSQLQMAAQQNASNAFFAKAAVLQKSAVTSPNNQLKLPTISANSASAAATNNGSSASAASFGFKDPRITISAGSNNCAKQTLATT